MKKQDYEVSEGSEVRDLGEIYHLRKKPRNTSLMRPLPNHPPYDGYAKLSREKPLNFPTQEQSLEDFLRGRNRVLKSIKI